MAVALGLVLVACRDEPAEDERREGAVTPSLRAERNACPRGHAPDEARLERLLGRLRDAPEAAALVTAHPAVCFGEPPVSVVTQTNVVLLRTDAGDGEAAARLAHLLHHVRYGLPYSDGADPRSCAERVDAALRREARAYALETALRERFGVDAPLRPYPFEAEARADPARAVETILSWLRQNPGGGANVDALAESYRERCEGEAR